MILKEVFCRVLLNNKKKIICSFCCKKTKIFWKLWSVLTNKEGRWSSADIFS